MVAVPADEGDEVFLGPVFKEGGVAVLLLGPGPGVGEFVHHQEAHAVAKVQEFRCRRVVAAADGVAAHFPEHLEAAGPGVVAPGGTKDAGIVVQAHALQEGLLSIEVEAVRAEFCAADPEGGFIGVAGTIGPLHHGARQVHLRFLRAPEAHVREVEGLDDFLAVVNAVFGAGFGHEDFTTAFLVKDAGDNAYGLEIIRSELQALGDAGGGADDLGGDVAAPMGHGRLFGGGEPDIAVEAAAGVPAGALGLVVQGNLYDVVPGLHVRVQLHFPGGVAVGPAAGFLAVDVYDSVGKSAVHLQAKVFLEVFGSEFKEFGIGGFPPPGQFARFSGVLLKEGLFHAPVVREIHSSRDAVLRKGPALVPQFSSGGLGCRSDNHRQCSP